MTYSVYDTAKGQQLLDRVPAEVVIRKMKMLDIVIDIIKPLEENN